MQLLLVLLTAIVLFSCRKDDAESPQSQDPIVGNWKLRALTYNGQTADVTNKACFKDSFMNFSAKQLNYKLSMPDNNNQCQNATETVDWKNKNGIYYVVQNGQESPMGIKLTDNNMTLNWTLSENGQNITFTYRK